MAAATDPDSPKITMQYRSKGTMIYELECKGGISLDLHVSSNASEDDWRVEAHNGRAEGAVVLAGSASTAMEALRELGRAWAAEASERGLPRHDWDAVVRVLHAVRAV